MKIAQICNVFITPQTSLIRNPICYRSKENTVARSLALQKQMRRYASVALDAEVVSSSENYTPRLVR